MTSGNVKSSADVRDKKESLRRLFSINTRMLPAKFAYILYGGNIGSHIAFLNVFFTSVGLSTLQAGLITGIRYVSATISQPLWGYIADYTGKRKLILIILCIGAALPMFCMPWVSRWIYPKSHYELCTRNSTLGNGTFGISRFTNITEYTNAVDKCETEKKHAVNTLFYVLLVIVTFASTFEVPLPCYVDTIVMNVVKTGTEKASYGGQRIFGSLGFSLANLLAGIAADRYREVDMSNYTAVFYLFLPYTLMLIPIGCYLIGQSNYTYTSKAEETTPANQENVGNLFTQVFRIFFRFDVLFFMTTVMICGLANNLFMNFAYMLVKDEMNVSKTKMTLVVVTAAMSETLVFPFTSKIIKMVGGNTPAIILGMFSYSVRFLVMSYRVPYGILVAVQTLHSLGFALSFAAMMEHVHEISPAQINVTMNSIMMMMFFSVSNLLANMLGGEIYQKYGGRQLFFGKAILCGIWGGLMIMYYGYKQIRSKYLHKVELSVKYKFSNGEYNKGKGGVPDVLGIDNPISCIEDEHDVTVAIRN